MIRRVLPSLAAALVFGLGLGAKEQSSAETPLSEGKEAYRAHRPSEAIDPLRIAAFGLLDRPALLCEALVYLALAYETSGLHADAESTLDRFNEVQRKFPACRDARLDPGVRTEFESRFRTRLPAAASAPPTPAPGASKAAPPPAAVPAAAPKASPSLPSREAPPTPRPARQSETGAAADENETPPRIKRSVPPVYPPAARQAGAGGTVILHVLVSETGKPMQVEVVRAVRPDLADAAVVSMQYWSFEPARRNGQPVRAWATIEVPFQP